MLYVVAIGPFVAMSFESIAADVGGTGTVLGGVVVALGAAVVLWHLFCGNKSDEYEGTPPGDLVSNVELINCMCLMHKHFPT